MPSRRRENDVIAALATPPGRGAVGIVRVSGLGTAALLERLVLRNVPARQATLAKFRAADGSIIDEGLVLYFPGPRSYTGEDVIELQGHGGAVVTQMVLRRCLELGARFAEPGEFTKRAFLNQRIDLAQAEGVADLIDAETVEAARCAMRSLEGEFSQRIRALGMALTDLQMLAEATIDFPEEEVEPLPAADANERLCAVRSLLDETISASKQGKLLREGVYVVIAGAPNVGKSSLLNLLAGDEIAIVTDVPGTTRDPVRETINVSGVPLHIIDTAGLREPRDPVERIGISRTWERVARADLMLWMNDATLPDDNCIPREFWSRLPDRTPVIIVRNKIDLTGEPARRSLGGGRTTVTMSAKTGAGLSNLKAAMLDEMGWRRDNGGLFLARERHLSALYLSSEALARASLLCNQADLFAEELRVAQNSLGEILGKVTADDLLGHIFSRFCIGK